jgi:hypothetical protein
MRRQVSQNNELQNSSINNSHLLDPEDFVMSNTSMSLHTQSYVLGVDTERGNVLKDSGHTLHEDSSMLYDNEEPRIPINAHPLQSNYDHRLDFNDDTPQQHRYQHDLNY